MGTHSLIIVQHQPQSTQSAQHKPEIYAVIYQQYDGYLDGVGQLLYNLLRNVRVVNGIPAGDTRDVANGPGCLAARIVAFFKNKSKNANRAGFRANGISGPEWAGGCYLLAPSKFSAGLEEEWNYYITVKGEEEVIFLKIRSSGEDIYDGPIYNAKSLFNGNPELPTVTSSDEEKESSEDNVVSDGNTVAVITEEGEVEYHELNSHEFNDMMPELLDCEEYDYMQISPYHTIYIPIGEDVPDRKVLTKCDEEGQMVDVTEEDVEMLPDLLEADARERELAVANFDAKGIKLK
jgi:hypothetical protein